ncbi:hypothetical protein HIM_02316 [Hirsutella minnesotensis 3608]|nr:hypothetical protein HIM_02316 [Hirsutella minnesotensis 3608]
MEKVWFKLRQTHYPPGPEAKILAGDGDDSQASICLGHCIPDLKHIDFPINSGAVVAFPTRIKVFHSQSLEFKWNDTRSSGFGLSLGAGSALAAALGLLTVKASIRLAFKNSVEEHEGYERLDTYFVQPNRRYIASCLETDALKEYVDDRLDWSLFMITGIKVARAGGKTAKMVKDMTIDGGPDLAGTATATGKNDKKHLQEMGEASTSDFIWAVRLAKVHKGILMTDWSLDPYTNRATFGVGEGEEFDVALVISHEGLDDFAVIEDEDVDEAFVMEAKPWRSA